MPKIVTIDRHRHYMKNAVAYLCCGACFLHFCEAGKVQSCCDYGLCLSAERLTGQMLLLLQQLTLCEQLVTLFPCTLALYKAERKEYGFQACCLLQPNALFLAGVLNAFVNRKVYLVQQKFGIKNPLLLSNYDDFLRTFQLSVKL